MSRIDTCPHTSHGLMDFNPNTKVVSPAIYTVVKNFPSEAESAAITKQIEATSNLPEPVIVYSAGT